MNQDPFLFSPCRKEKWFLDSVEKRALAQGLAGLRHSPPPQGTMRGAPAFRSAAARLQVRDPAPLRQAATGCIRFQNGLPRQ